MLCKLVQFDEVLLVICDDIDQRETVNKFWKNTIMQTNKF